MLTTRRSFLKTGSTALATAASLSTISKPLLAQLGTTPEPVPPIEDPRLKQLTQRALDAAKSAGATYADVRLSHTRDRAFDDFNINDHEAMHVGVRALVNGYWGFASGPVWSPDEMTRLGREAVHHAKTNALGKPRTVELAPTPVIENETWVMPVKIDPFEVYPREILDFLRGLRVLSSRIPHVNADQTRVRCYCYVQEKAFAASPGTYITQRVYRTSGEFAVSVEKDRRQGGAYVDTLTAAGMGWELFQDQPFEELLQKAVDEAIETIMLPVKPVDVGRYDVAIDAMGVGDLVSKTIGVASELDRALGYEANAGGTSYLNDPFEMLGTYKIGAPLLNVSANRTTPECVATVRWDDEGVATEPFTLVKDGILSDYQTMREGASWIRDCYTKTGAPIRSHACAYAPTAVDVPLAHTANLEMKPGDAPLDFNALVSSMSKGVAFKAMSSTVDFNQLNGLGVGTAFEVKGGKRVATFYGGGVLFRAPELWKNLVTLGGSESARRYGRATEKGEPRQVSYHSTTTVPAIFKDMTVIDYLRKA
jgi:TldD protein